MTFYAPSPSDKRFIERMKSRIDEIEGLGFDLDQMRRLSTLGVATMLFADLIIAYCPECEPKRRAIDEIFRGLENATRALLTEDDGPSLGKKKL